MAEKAMELCSTQEFGIHLLPSEILLNAVELGQACIRQDHRNGRTLYMLWKGVANYLSYTAKRFLFGCCSISSTDPCEGWRYYRFLNKNHFVETEILIPVAPHYNCRNKIEIADEIISLPDLFELCLNLGAKV